MCWKFCVLNANIFALPPSLPSTFYILNIGMFLDSLAFARGYDIGVMKVFCSVESGAFSVRHIYQFDALKYICDGKPERKCLIFSDNGAIALLVELAGYVHAYEGRYGECSSSDDKLGAYHQGYGSACALVRRQCIVEASYSKESIVGAAFMSATSTRHDSSFLLLQSGSNVQIYTINM